MSAKYYALLTNIGVAKITNAAALGTKLNITEMAVGDGGGALPTPTPEQTTLVNERRRAPINQLSIDPINDAQIIVEQVIPENIGGWWIREVGLYDADGDLVAVSNCAETYKPLLQEGSGRTQTVRMVIIVSNTANVTLKIDPAVVLATRKYVDDQYSAHINSENPHKQYLKTSNALSEIYAAGEASKKKAVANLGLSAPIGFSLIGGVRGQVRTSEAGSLEAAITLALASNADVLVDNEQNITTPIRKALNGNDLAIKSTANGWIKFTPTDIEKHYKVITLDGTGVERVITRVKMDGGKVRGIGRAIVGVTTNKIYAHYDASEIRNVSACVEVITAQIHVCYGSKFYGVYQQLASQEWDAGVYGYGSVAIDCELVSIDSCIFGIAGAPIDRHAVYCSSFDDGTGVNRNVFISRNRAVMRDYTIEDAETRYEKCFKCIGSKRTHIHNNDLVGGYGFLAFTCRKDQVADYLEVSNNSARTYSAGIVITSQDAEAAQSNATWYLAELKSSNNSYRFRNKVAGISNGIEWRNTLKVSDIGSSYTNELFATISDLAIYYPKKDRVRAELLRSAGCYYQGFDNITREYAPEYVDIDITCRNANNTVSPLNAQGATVQRVRLRSVDNTGVWRSFTANRIVGFSYYDPGFEDYIRNDIAGSWRNSAGFKVVGLSTARPDVKYDGMRYYQTDQSNFIKWTGSAWVLESVGFDGIKTSGNTVQIDAIPKNLLGYGHCIYNTDAKKPVFFDALTQAWKYADGSTM